MNKALLPGYIRCYTGPATDIAQGLRRIVIHRRESCEEAVYGGTDYAVHYEASTWHLYWGNYGLSWLSAIELAQQREEALLTTAVVANLEIHSAS